MLTYTVEHIGGPTSRSRKTLYVEGRVDCRKLDQLQRMILDFLSYGDELVVNLEGMEECDNSIYRIICQVRERAKRMGIRLIIKGKGRCSTDTEGASNGNTRNGGAGI